MSERTTQLAVLDSIGPSLDWIRAHAPDWVTDDVIELGVVEAVTNAIRHGSKPSEEHPPVIEIGTCHTDRCFLVEVKWFGVPWAEADRRAELPDDPFANSGRGLAIMTALFDRVAWSADGMSIFLELSPR